MEISGWNRTAVLAVGGAAGVLVTAAIIHMLVQSGVLEPGPGAA